MSDIGHHFMLQWRSLFHPYNMLFEPLRCRLLSLRANMRRREFISLVGGAAATWPLTAHAQQADRVRQIDVLSGADEAGNRVRSANEGIVCKRIDLPYRHGPSKSWIKVKNKKHPAMLRVKEAFELERRGRGHG